MDVQINHQNDIKRLGKTNLWTYFLILAVLTGCASLSEHAQTTSQPTEGLKQIIDPVSHGPENTGDSNRSEIKPVNETEGCPGTGWDIQKMLDNGERLYSSYCVACHGRQGQGYSYFPALVGDGALDSKNLDNVVYIMMNTDIHPMASLLFQRDALSVINYVRQSFGSQPTFVCPGDVDIHINP